MTSYLFCRRTIVLAGMTAVVEEEEGVGKMGAPTPRGEVAKVQGMSKVCDPTTPSSTSSPSSSPSPMHEYVFVDVFNYVYANVSMTCSCISSARCVLHGSKLRLGLRIPIVLYVH
jgi:hypothetical protein